APIIYVIGGPKDIAYPNAMDDFKRIENVPVVIINLDVGHGGTYAQPHGGAFSGPTISWLKWQLKGDEEAALMFKGGKCGLCNDPEWEIETKNIN
ncbi:glycoside hydrolase family 10, partial [Thermodesulfobacteriota bacterium]